LLAAAAARLVLLAVSPRVAPGQFTAQAWDILRGARRVLVGPAADSQLAALAEAGVTAQTVGVEPAGAGAVAELAGLLGQEVAARPPSWSWAPGTCRARTCSTWS
jgi:XTP/dITP diphosphohydrolase